MHSLRQRRISSGSSSISSSSVVAARSLTLQLQDIRVKQRRTASQWQTFRIWHSRLHAASRNLEEQTETALMARLLTTLLYRLKLAPSSQCHPWLKSGSKCTHQSYREMGLVAQRLSGTCHMGPLLWHTITKCLFHASPCLFPPPHFHLAVPHPWAPQHGVSGQELTLSIYKTMQIKSIQRLVQKHLMFVALRPLCPFKLEKKFCLFSPQMEMVMQAKKNVINNTNCRPLGEILVWKSDYSAWICHAIRSLSGFSWLFTYAYISLLPHMVLFPYLFRV